MTICGQTWSRRILQRIQRAVEAEPELSRRALSRRVCEWLNWRTSLGKLKEVSCRVALLRLQRRGQVQLPVARPAVRPSPRRMGAEPERPPESIPREASLGALQPVSLVRIESAESAVSRVWNELMNRYHYLGAGPCAEHRSDI